MLPYDADALLALVGLYNRALWPVQPVVLAAAVLALVLAIRGRPGSGRVVAVLLVAAWSWTGLVYQGGYYASLNWAGGVYAVLFLAQALAMTWWGVVRRWSPTPRAGDGGVQAGAALAMLALVAPLLELVAGVPADTLQVVGLLPDATAVFSLGVLLTMRGAPRRLWVLPALWCAWSALWWWQLGSTTRAVLPVLALLVLAWVWWLRRRAT